MVCRLGDDRNKNQINNFVRRVNGIEGGCDHHVTNTRQEIFDLRTTTSPPISAVDNRWAPDWRQGCRQFYCRPVQRHLLRRQTISPARLWWSSEKGKGKYWHVLFRSNLLFLIWLSASRKCGSDKVLLTTMSRSSTEIAARESRNIL